MIKRKEKTESIVEGRYQRKRLEEAEIRVEGRYVHKKKLENILLSNLRRALPTHIPKEVLDKEIEAAEKDVARDDPDRNFTEKDKRKLLRYYMKLKVADFPYLHNDDKDKKMEGEYYVLLNVPHRLPPEDIDGKHHFSPKEREELKNFYTFSEKQKCYILSKSVRDVEEIQILNILQRKDICMTDIEKYELSEILQKLPGVPKDNIFYTNMIVDLLHPFFFEHPTEHMPGMMIIEAARQFVVAVCHKFGNVPVEDFSMILDQFSAEFRNYIELHHPVRLKGVITKLDGVKDGVWQKKMAMDIFVLQDDAITGVLKIGGQGISKRLFAKLRRTLPKEHKKPRFCPIPTFMNAVTIHHDESEENLQCHLINLSLSGMCVEMNEPILARDEMPLFECVFYFPEIGFIFGKCRIVWQDTEDQKYYAGLEIVSLSPGARDHLYEAIKRFCYVMEEREIL